MADPGTTQGTGPGGRLLAATGFVVVGLALSGAQSVGGIGLPCPWRALTHTLCPFCGATTMGVALLHGDLAAAWAANPFVLVLLAGVALGCVVWLVQLAGGPVVRLPRPLTRPTLWYSALGAIALVFAVARNLPLP